MNAAPPAPRLPLRVDVVSDITCPWCAIGLHALEQAIARLDGAVPVDVHLHPFELNPDMPPEGEPIGEYAARKHGAGAEELARRQALIRRSAAEAGLAFPARTHVYNTFDAHRLLLWAATEGRQRALKQALLAAYHVRGENPARHDVLLKAAASAGLHVVRASEVLASGAFAAEVRASTRAWQERGVDGVPAIVLGGRHLIQGGRTVEAYENALRRFAEGRA